jgi:hypothetical protein
MFLMRASLVAIVVSAVAGCTDETSIAEVDETQEESGVSPEESPAAVAREQVCDAAGDALGAAGLSQCDQAIAGVCEELVATFSDPLVDALVSCVVDAGVAPLDCIAAAFAQLRPTAAHLQLASSYCSECAADVPGCEQIFYFGDDDNLGAGMILLPFSDEVVNDITAECTESFLCAVEFPGCVRDVLEERLVPEAPYDCLLESLVGG